MKFDIFLTWNIKNQDLLRALKLKKGHNKKYFDVIYTLQKNEACNMGPINVDREEENNEDGVENKYGRNYNIQAASWGRGKGRRVTKSLYFAP